MSTREVTRCVIKSVTCDGKPHLFWYGADGMNARTRKRAVWTVIWDGEPRRIVTTLERGLQQRGLL